MKSFCLLIATGVLCTSFPPEATAAASLLALHPDNPHYFLFRARPTVLVTSGEHYGAVINADFDTVRYLDTLAKDGLNLTRTFSGAYVEPAGAFNITSNTLAPLPGRFLAPWARSDQPGYAGGGNKFDLSKWDSAYFDRLRRFVGDAAIRGIVVEVNLFCPFYDEAQWQISPLNPRNNVQGLPDLARTNVYCLERHGGLLPLQEAMVRKIVRELRNADNIYYEICNEPYFGGVTSQWQEHIADIIVDAEREGPEPHLISQNIANGSARIQHPHPAISIFNFHYAAPPEAVAENYHLRKAIGDNETGFRGVANRPYRVEAWEFLLAGGGLFNHLDYSFAVGHENGTFRYPRTTPGGGNPELRHQLATLNRFVHGFDFIRLSPLPPNAIKRPSGLRARGLAEAGRAYGLYFARDWKDGEAPASQAVAEQAKEPTAADRILLEVPRGRYRIEWIDPLTGVAHPPQNVRHSGGPLELRLPPFTEDIALKINRR
jgi:hypothetical protein